MHEIRCENCNQLLVKVDYCVGEIKCSRCKKIVKINVQDRVSHTTKKNGE